MPDTKLSALPATTSPASADLTYLDHSGVSTGATLGNLGKALDSGVIPNTPAGNIASTNVQAAINELDTEKAALAGATFTGTVALGANSLTMTGSLAATGARVTKGWFTDLEVTNLPTVNGGALASALSLGNYVLLAGAAGGQTIDGGTLTTQNLTLRANAADTTTGSVAITTSTASTTKTTGALTVAGGVGVVGAIFSNDLTVTNTIVGSISGNAATVTSGLYTTDIGTKVAAGSSGLAGGQTVAGGTGASENLTLYSTTNATKGFIYLGNGQSAFDETQGHLGVGTTTPLFRLCVWGNNANDSTICERRFSTNTGGGAINFIKARGTAASPTAALSGDQLGQVQFGGYVDTVHANVAIGGQIDMYATENYSSTAHGCEMRFYTTPNTTASEVLALTIGQDKLATFAGALTGTTGTFASASSLTLGTASSAVGAITFKNASNTNNFIIQAGATGASITHTLPATAPTDGQVLSSLANGTMSWVTAGGLSWGSSISGTTTGGLTLTQSNSSDSGAIGLSIIQGNTQANAIIGVQIDTGTSAVAQIGLNVKSYNASTTAMGIQIDASTTATGIGINFTGAGGAGYRGLYFSEIATVASQNNYGLWFDHVSSGANAASNGYAIYFNNVRTNTNTGIAYGMYANVVNDGSNTGAAHLIYANTLTDGSGSGLTTALYVSKLGIVNKGNAAKFFSLNNTQSGTTLESRTNDTSEYVLSRTSTATSGTVADNYNILKISNTNVMNGSGGTFTVAGSFINLTATDTQTAGTLTPSYDLLSLNPSTLSTGSSIHLTVANSTVAPTNGHIYAVLGNTQAVAHIGAKIDLGTSAQAHTALQILNVNGAASIGADVQFSTAGTGIGYKSTSSKLGGGEQFVSLSHTASGTITACSVDKFNLASSRTHTGTTTVSETFNIATISRTSVANNASANLTEAGNVLKITNTNTNTSSTAFVDTVNVLNLTQSATVTTGKLFTGVVGATERFKVHPMVANSGTNNAYLFDTTTAISGTTTHSIFAVAGTPILTIDNAGNQTSTGWIKTAAPNTGTASQFKMGILVTDTVAADTTRYIQLDVGGVLYKVIISSI